MEKINSPPKYINQSKNIKYDKYWEDIKWIKDKQDKLKKWNFRHEH